MAMDQIFYVGTWGSDIFYAREKQLMFPFQCPIGKEVNAAAKIWSKTGKQQIDLASVAHEMLTKVDSPSYTLANSEPSLQELKRTIR